MATTSKTERMAAVDLKHQERRRAREASQQKVVALAESRRDERLEARDARRKKLEADRGLANARANDGAKHSKAVLANALESHRIEQAAADERAVQLREVMDAKQIAASGRIERRRAEREAARAKQRLDRIEALKAEAADIT